jgi:hypothetical protein
VVPGSPVAQGTPNEEEQQQQDHNEDRDNEEYSPLSDTDGEKLYRDAEEIESFRAEAPVPAGRDVGSARTLVHHLCSQVSDQGNPASRVSGVQGRRGDLPGA